MSVYAIRRYPRTVELRGGVQIVIRPMERGDGDGLLQFFLRVPADERFYLKDDVASPEVIGSFVEHLDYDRALPLLALDGQRVVGDAVLVRHRGGYRAHTGEIRLVIDPEYRGKGLGVVLMTELADIAWDAELDSVEFELIRDVQDEAIAAAEHVGAFNVGTVKEFVKDAHGKLHDLVFLRIPLGKWWQWSSY
jgi:GNAT superfamily N-acetyltransferase